MQLLLLADEQQTFAMFRLIVLTFLLVEASADEDLTAADSVAHLQVYSLDDVHHHDHQKPHHVHLGDVHDKQHSKVDKIVSEFFNPDYVEPITVLDYRYLKTGGRDYTRGPGGQILILPKGVRIHEKKEFENYDAMLDFLREKQIAEHEAHHKAHHGYVYHKHHVEMHGEHHHDHDHHDKSHHHEPDLHHDRKHHTQHGSSMYGGNKRNVESTKQKIEDDKAQKEKAELEESVE